MAAHQTGHDGCKACCMEAITVGVVCDDSALVHASRIARRSSRHTYSLAAQLGGADSVCGWKPHAQDGIRCTSDTCSADRQLQGTYISALCNNNVCCSLACVLMAFLSHGTTSTDPLAHTSVQSPMSSHLHRCWKSNQLHHINCSWQYRPSYYMQGLPVREQDLRAHDSPLRLRTLHSRRDPRTLPQLSQDFQSCLRKPIMPAD